MTSIAKSLLFASPDRASGIQLCLPEVCFYRTWLMKRAARKDHRTLAMIVCLPVALTVMTGMAITIVGEWSLNLGRSRRLLLKRHTGESLHLQAIDPILNGMGMIGLWATGLSLSGLFKRKVYGV